MHSIGQAEAQWKQVLWEGVMEALGYSKNRAPFRALAEGVTIELLASLGGSREAIELRDGDQSRYMGKGVLEEWLRYTGPRKSRGTSIAGLPTTHMIAAEAAATPAEAFRNLRRDGLAGAASSQANVVLTGAAPRPSQRWHMVSSRCS